MNLFARLGAIYNDLFENRQKSDYMDLVRFEGDQVRPWIEDAQVFVETIVALLGGGLPTGDSANREQDETGTDRPED